MRRVPGKMEGARPAIAWVLGLMILGGSLPSTSAQVDSDLALLPPVVGGYQADPGVAPPNELADESGISPLTEGPVHEAFLAPGSQAAYVTVERAPPKPIVERPGVEKTDGRAVWIPGYWDWDPTRDDFVWVTGTWRVPPPGRFWVNGFWQRDEDGWTRIPGFWSGESADELTYFDEGPPEQRVEEAVPPAPEVDQEVFYVPGQYEPSPAGPVTWRSGYWTQVQPNWCWVPSYWIWQPRGWLYVPGYWDYVLDRRGTLFAPALVSPSVVVVNQPIVYRPVVTIAYDSFDLLYGPIGRPSFFYDGYPGCYFDPLGSYYSFSSFGFFGNRFTTLGFGGIFQPSLRLGFSFGFRPSLFFSIGRSPLVRRFGPPVSYLAFAPILPRRNNININIVQNNFFGDVFVGRGVGRGRGLRPGRIGRTFRNAGPLAYGPSATITRTFDRNFGGVTRSVSRSVSAGGASSALSLVRLRSDTIRRRAESTIGRQLPTTSALVRERGRGRGGPVASIRPAVVRDNTLRLIDQRRSTVGGARIDAERGAISRRQGLLDARNRAAVQEIDARGQRRSAAITNGSPRTTSPNTGVGRVNSGSARNSSLERLQALRRQQLESRSQTIRQQQETRDRGASQRASAAQAQTSQLRQRQQLLEQRQQQRRGTLPSQGRTTLGTTRRPSSAQPGPPTTRSRSSQSDLLRQRQQQLEQLQRQRVESLRRPTTQPSTPSTSRSTTRPTITRPSTRTPDTSSMLRARQQTLQRQMQLRQQATPSTSRTRPSTPSSSRFVPRTRQAPTQSRISPSQTTPSRSVPTLRTNPRPSSRSITPSRSPVFQRSAPRQSTPSRRSIQPRASRPQPRARPSTRSNSSRGDTRSRPSRLRFPNRN